MSTLTSVDMHVTRSTTRVLHRPGGESSIVLGGDPAPEPVRRDVRPAPEVRKEPEPAPAPAPVREDPIDRSATFGGRREGPSDHTFGITSRSSTRVSAPPGGFSSFTLG
eukprot:PLAT10325.1.p3 GENE.PLAT10325.1~~PLAT10325.1.p3  ORF type:complete len:109 (+),score=22.81 PLAT10325.1:104-430(+)